MVILTHYYDMRKYLLTVLLSFFIHQVYAQNIPAAEKLRINPDAAMGGTVSQYIDEVKYITFENNANSNFGDIDQLEVMDKYYIIWDRATAAVLIFNKQGKLHTKIKVQEKNPQHPNTDGFLFDKRDQMIRVGYIFDRSTFQTYFFDLDGKLVKQEKTSVDQYPGNEVSLGGNFSGYSKFWPTYPHPMADTVAYEIMVSAQGAVKEKYFPYHMNQKHYDSQSDKHGYDFSADPGVDSVAYYSREYDYNIYKLTPHTFQPVYQFIFPMQVSLPPDFKDDTLLDGKRRDFISHNKKTIYRIDNFFKCGDNLFFSPRIDDVPSTLSYVYNLGSKRLVCLNKIVSDTGSYFLPIADAEVGGSRLAYRGVLNSDGQAIYTSYSSRILFNQASATQNKGSQYPPSLKNYLRTQSNAKGNPVLVVLKFKP